MTSPKKASQIFDNYDTSVFKDVVEKSKKHIEESHSVRREVAPKKAEWEETDVKIINGVNFVHGDRVAKLISQTHTELCTTLKERIEGLKFPSVEGGSKEMPYTEFLTADPSKNETIMQFAHNQALKHVLTLIDSLLVTDEKV